MTNPVLPLTHTGKLLKENEGGIFCFAERDEKQSSTPSFSEWRALRHLLR
jgi:hypothetical protein